MNEFLDLEALAKELDNKLNGEDLANVIEFKLDKIYPNTLFVFRTYSETGEFLASETVENTVHRFIPGELTLTDSSSEGIGESTYNAVVQLKADFLIPLIGPEEKNKELLNKIRALLTDTLKYTINEPETIGDTIYTHIIDYHIATTGYRDQRDLIGDSISLTVYITHTYVALGISSNRYALWIKDANGKDVQIPYTKLGIARKTTADTNVFSGEDLAAPSAKSTPTDTVLTISIDMLTRIGALNYYVDRYNFLGIVEPMRIALVRPDPNDSQSNKTTWYTMIFNNAGVNAELDAISSTSVSFIETKELA